MFDLGPSRSEFVGLGRKVDRLARYVVQLARKGREMAGEIEALRASVTEVRQAYEQLAMLNDRLRVDLANTTQQLNDALANRLDPAAVQDSAAQLNQVAAEMRARLG